ncbi:unnamed protein product [Penicillium salamii]|nr:unnamed protein product [Penicillium salamii]CAG8421518.1 unnamed protein product [Penicillium salamii]
MTGSDHEVIPAQVSYLAIYNPTLGPTDETIADQVVYYTSQATHEQESAGYTADIEESKDLQNERLRQIGLAQGLVNFASNFSDGKSLEYVETDKSRVVLLELEKNWWIVASIDLTRLPVDSTQRSSSEEAPAFQYSSREMTPPPLLIQQLRRAHSGFLLHHHFTLDELLNQVGRSRLCLYLDRFWDKFTWKWELLMTGNPIVEIYNGIKLSAGGELGIGVGEEEWGSGEREVLEDFVTRTEGLVDLIVSRFGDPSPPIEEFPSPTKSDETQWLGADNDPRPSDGVVFTGIGALSRHSLAHVSHWMEWIYQFGDAAYGVGRDPGSLRRRKPRRPRAAQGCGDAPQSTPDRIFTPGIPRPLIMATPEPIQRVPTADQTAAQDEASPLRNEQEGESVGFPTETVMKYLTLGYGSSWSFSPKRISSPPPDSSDTSQDKSHSTPVSADQSDNTAQPPQADGNYRSDTRNKSSGRFILGPRDDLQILDDLEEGSPEPHSENGKPKSRIVCRTLYVYPGGPEATPRKLQAVIYVHQPFMFTFLFDPQTASLPSPSLYSSIHHQLGPLQKPLLSSTSPAMAASRTFMSGNSDPSKRFSAISHPIYDLVYDPSNLTIRSSIPNIPSLDISPQPPSHPAASSVPTWTRVETLAIHHRLLSTYTDTRSRPQELERTSKTARGWWVVWVRLAQPALSTALSTAPSSTTLSSAAHEPSSSSQAPQAPQAPQEAFIVRKASDYVSPTGHGRVSSGARFFRDLGGASSGMAYRADTTPSKLVEGLGMDARRYIEGLLSLNR